MIGMPPVRPRSGWRCPFRGVTADDDGHRTAGTPLRAAQDGAGVPSGAWKGRGSGRGRSRGRGRGDRAAARRPLCGYW
ncbi:putative TraA protein (plasmid) [Streptomyces clavuligerus]|uniref:Putative TraA protein n=1 Tax=Streptomyces clavuligerus TaxID=1901 RepID=D5SHW1_STRCL|nr:putative TraA protein [Streptomyces clavuligerus]